MAITEHENGPALRVAGRGRYERGQQRGARFVERRERLCRATARAAWEQRLTALRVIELAGVSATSFYECFDDVQHALAGAQRLAERELGRALRGARGSDFEGCLRSSCEVWLLRCAAERELSSVALVPGRAGLSALGQVFASFVTELMARFELPANGEAVRFTVACAESSARSLVGRGASAGEARQEAECLTAASQRLLPVALPTCA